MFTDTEKREQIPARDHECYTQSAIRISPLEDGTVGTEALVGSTQLNVRIGRDVKAAGDAALAEEGIAPSTIVRALWQALAQRGERLQQVREVLGLVEQQDDQLQERERRAELARRGGLLVCEGCAELGISMPEPESDTRLWRELREDAVLQRLSDRGLV